MKKLLKPFIPAIILTIVLALSAGCSGGESSGGDSLTDDSATIDAKTEDAGSYSGTLVINEIVASPVGDGND